MGVWSEIGREAIDSTHRKKLTDQIQCTVLKSCINKQNFKIFGVNVSSTKCAVFHEILNSIVSLNSP